MLKNLCSDADYNLWVTLLGNSSPWISHIALDFIFEETKKCKKFVLDIDKVVEKVSDEIYKNKWEHLPDNESKKLVDKANLYLHQYDCFARNYTQIKPWHLERSINLITRHFSALFIKSQDGSKLSKIPINGLTLSSHNYENIKNNLVTYFPNVVENPLVFFACYKYSVDKCFPHGKLYKIYKESFNCGDKLRFRGSQFTNDGIDFEGLIATAFFAASHSNGFKGTNLRDCIRSVIDYLFSPSTLTTNKLQNLEQVSNVIKIPYLLSVEELLLPEINLPIGIF